MNAAPIPPERHRRDFLRGDAALAALGHWVDSQGLPAPPDRDRIADRDRAPHRDRLAQPLEPAAGGYVLQLERPAMACRFQCCLNAGEHPGSEAAALEALELVGELEEQLSIYKPHSEISQLNRWGASQAQVLEPRLFGLLELSCELHTFTEGAFDITAGPLSQVWGFSRRAGRIPDPVDLEAARQRVGSHQLWLDRNAGTAQLGRVGMEINLGAIGKGYALDRCREQLEQAGLQNFLLHGGQSSLLAVGQRAGASPGWAVGIRHPQKTDVCLLQLRLVDKALGTSGSATQSFYVAGRRYGHILDPRTGWPADHPIHSVSVMAPTAAIADALATACFVLGPERTWNLCQRDPQLGALFVGPAQRSGNVRVEFGGSITPDLLQSMHPWTELVHVTGRQ